MPQIMMECQYALHEINSKLLTKISRKALSFAGYSDIVARYRGNISADFENKTLDVFRTLARDQDDISASDLEVATSLYDGPPEGVEILLAHSSLHFERFDIAEDVGTAPPLAIALRCYSRTLFLDNGPRLDDHACAPQAAYLPEHKQWEPLLKRFIPKGANLHVPVPRDGYSRNYTLPVSEYGTPLDVLFQFSGTPDEARTIGAEWLGLLASKGHDVVAYLKKEMILHAPDHQITYPVYNLEQNIPPPQRELYFAFDDARPCVWWDWWIDPASDIDLLEREFKDMVKYTCVEPILWTLSLIDTWPFEYPVWYDNPEKVAQNFMHEDMEPDERRRRAHVAMQRANRRLQKRFAKNAYSKGLRHSKVPGAWPASSWD